MFNALININNMYVIQISRKLFTYPCSWLMARKWVTDEDGTIREEVNKQWKAFAVCKPKKKFVFEEDAIILVQVG